MCCCGKPNVNGTPNGYSWDSKSRTTRQPDPPALAEGDMLVHDEPGRCGGVDAHSHHFRWIKGRYDHAVLVRHGGGDERISLGVIGRLLAPSLDAMDSTGRYWLMHAIYTAQRDATESATRDRDAYWRKAAAEKRIRTRKLPGRNSVRVTVDPPRMPVAEAA